jgi:hypothetical protein
MGTPRVDRGAAPPPRRRSSSPDRESVAAGDVHRRTAPKGFPERGTRTRRSGEERSLAGGEGRERHARSIVRGREGSVLGGQGERPAGARRMRSVLSDADLGGIEGPPSRTERTPLAHDEGVVLRRSERPSRVMRVPLRARRTLRPRLATPLCARGDPLCHPIHRNASPSGNRWPPPRSEPATSRSPGSDEFTSGPSPIRAFSTRSKYANSRP